MPEPEYLTSMETAAMLRIHPVTLAKMRMRKTGPKYYRLGSRKRSSVLYRKAEVVTWLEANAHTFTGEY